MLSNTNLAYQAKIDSPDRRVRRSSTPLVFGAGAYVRGPMRGLQNNTLRRELVVLALVSLIRSMAPGHKFSSFTVLQNVTSKLHRDQRNLQGSSNLVLPLTNFEGGELWVQCSGGASSMAGHSGHVLPLLQDGVPTPQFFDPRVLHATLPWSGCSGCLHH